MATGWAFFDARSIIQRTLIELRLSIGDLARLQTDAPLGRATLERVLRGERLLQNDEAQLLETLCSELRALHAEAQFPINYRDAQRVREILLARRMFSDTGMTAGVRALGCNGGQVEFE